MTSYVFIKYLHVSCAVLTLLGFSLRGFWMLTENGLLQNKLTRVLPHVIDTVLLVSAITLVVMSGLYPFRVDWVTIKIGLLLLYIVLGTFALKRGRNRRSRAYFFAAALITVAAIFVVALTKPSI